MLIGSLDRSSLEQSTDLRHERAQMSEPEVGVYERASSTSSGLQIEPTRQSPLVPLSLAGRYLCRPYVFCRMGIVVWPGVTFRLFDGGMGLFVEHRYKLRTTAESYGSPARDYGDSESLASLDATRLDSNQPASLLLTRPSRRRPA